MGHLSVLLIRALPLAGAAVGLQRLAAAAMAGDSSLSPGVARFLARPLVGRALLMRSLAALTGDLALLGAVHRSESTIFLGHVSSSRRSLVRRSDAEAVSRGLVQRRCHEPPEMIDVSGTYLLCSTAGLLGAGLPDVSRFVPPEPWVRRLRRQKCSR